MLRIALSLAVCFYLAVPAVAQAPTVSLPAAPQASAGANDIDLDAATMAGTNLHKTTFRAGTTRVDVYAGSDVDVAGLMRAAKVRVKDAPQDVVDKVNAVRQRLYPDKEMALSVAVPKTSSPTIDRTVSLYRYYLLWNRSSDFYAYWNSMSSAVLFIDDVSGGWYVYDCNNCSSWRYITTVYSGGAYTRALYSGYFRRGFNLRRKYSGSRADIVMYFFY